MNQSLASPDPLRLVEATKAAHLGVVMAAVMEVEVEATEGHLPLVGDVKSLSITSVIPYSPEYRG